jgi:excisionase family DNA binding protein
VSGQAQSPTPRGPAPNRERPRGQLLTADDVAARWQVPRSHVYGLTRSGALPVVRLGRYYRYALAAIEEFEASGGAAPDA